MDIDLVDEPVSVQALLLARRPRIVVTPVIVAIEVALFVTMAAITGELWFLPTTLERWGGLQPMAVETGAWWRLLAAMWLHADPLHLFINALCLWQVGGYVERLLGPLAFVVVYLLTGLVASAASLQMLPGTAIAVGASGAVFGLVGVLLAVAIAGRRTHRLAEVLGELRTRLVAIIAYNLFAGFVVPGIDNAAHIGGLVAGLAFGWLIARDSLAATPPPRRTLIPIAIAAGLTVAAVASASDRRDLASEITRFGRESERVEAAFVTTRADVEAQRRTRADAAAEIERTVLPLIRAAQLRGNVVLTAAEAQVAAASARDPHGRLHDWRRLPGFRVDLEEAHAWMVFLAAYDEAWRLRASGLRERDAARLDQADKRAAEASDALAVVLARSRPANLD
jgi:membrane associated rhomboid family serine protease